MKNNFIPLNIEKIKSFIADGDLKSRLQIEIFDSIDSTNNYLKKSLSKNNDNISICLAEQQTAGKGSSQRSWHSPFGENIYFSCSWVFNQSPEKLRPLSLVSSLAVLQTLKEIGVDNNNLRVKWPNDLLWQQKKLSGTLIEIISTNKNITTVVIGVGININMTDANSTAINQPINQQWTSVANILKKSFDRNIIIAKLITYLASALKIMETEGWPAFIDLWQQHDALFEKEIKINAHQQQFKGKAAGVNQAGQLLLKLSTGETMAFSTGDASIEKEYNGGNNIGTRI